MEMMIQCAVASGLGDRLVRVFLETEKGKIKQRGRVRERVSRRMQMLDGMPVCIHPSSLLHSRVYELLEQKKRKQLFLVYHKMMSTSRVYIYDCSMISVMPVILLGCGPVLRLSKDRKLLLFGRGREGKNESERGGGGMRISIKESDGVLIKEINKRVREIWERKRERRERDKNIKNFEEEQYERELFKVVCALCLSSQAG
mmetsp:Transcript_14290/g.14395  ORF Transcript_14290/g.14395 Transcript_14290/m.14395 type:complete len:201 (+) Transcript_14290:407-1009(+)